MNYMKVVEKQLKLIKETILKVEDNFHKEIIEILYWFNSFLWYQFFHNENKNQIKQWDIYEINLWRNIWSELNKKRPCVVVSANWFNQGKTVVVVPLKSVKTYSKNWIITIFIDKEWTNLDKESFVSISNIREISKKRIWRKIGKVSKKDMLKVVKSLSIFLWIKKRTSQGSSS